MAKPTVIIVGADKGGVGKTTVARTLLDYFGAHRIAARAFDTEAPRGTLKRFHPDATEIVDLRPGRRPDEVFDTLNSADMPVTVIDVRAGLLSQTLRALRDFGFIEAARKGQITFAVFHVLGPTIASLDEIEQTAAFLGDAKYFLVKNFINDTHFFQWDREDLRAPSRRSRTRSRSPSPSSTRWRASRSSWPRSRSCLHRQQEAERRAGGVFLRAARLCPALARLCLGRVRPHPADRPGDGAQRAGGRRRARIADFDQLRMGRRM